MKWFLFPKTDTFYLHLHFYGLDYYVILVEYSIYNPFDLRFMTLPSSNGKAKKQCNKLFLLGQCMQLSDQDRKSINSSFIQKYSYLHIIF